MVTRRLLGVAMLLIALAGAVWAGTIVREHLEGPGPVATVRTATEAYASGDCKSLREVMVRPKSVDCSAVRQIQQAYRDEGLKPAEFTYALASQDDDRATVRISYVKSGSPLDELITVEKDDGEWKISETGGQPE